ncbi:lipocalin [Acidovorax sp. SRB_14]|uniref:lipocalin family protein n=1 Tax=unclassified Acidovorax TaxID=2684926 RepID=UPI00145E65AD|nr:MULTISPECIES: lipocalin family protein [unclassified Acidovorax]NMM75321.1 lipocalin [Acidovorax sp. SRB_24]NMM80828.1 lipocalin [Acidovorax sp. SRB_14]NMM85801.1 lipocalin [Rhodococcus sp. SRB_17]
MRIRPSVHRSPWLPAALGFAALLSVLALSACATSTPAGVHAVHFDVDRYAGHWYELARIDHRFEKGLIRTSAHYSRNADGTIEVLNRGFDPVHQRWKESVGKARFLGDPTQAALKVSFFGPFYGGYHVVALDPEYQWAMVVGSSLDYFWILSRTPTLPEGIKNQLLARTRALGVDENQVRWVQQDGVNPTGL